MRNLTCSFAATAALALTACGGGSGPAENAASEQAPGPDSIQAQLEALPEGQRNAVFIRAIRDAGNACQHVESSERGGEYRGLPVWRARCDGGSSFTIVITSGGVAQVLDDSQVRLGNESAPAQGEER